MATVVGETESALRPRRRGVGVAWTLTSSTLRRAWNDRVLGLAAEAGFWQLLSLPSMLLGIVGIIGYFSGSLGADTIHDIENATKAGHDLRGILLPAVALDQGFRQIAQHARYAECQPKRGRPGQAAFHNLNRSQTLQSQC